MGTKNVAGGQPTDISREATSLREKAARIRCLVLDVDGTMTDGKLYFGAHGEAMKAFSVLDGQGLALLAKGGVTVAIITGRSSEIVRLRAVELNIKHVVQGTRNKIQAFTELQAKLGLEASQMAMMGDDWPDLPVFGMAGLAAAPCDAHAEVLQRADWVSQRKAGDGAVRELCDYLLQVQGKYQKLLDGFLNQKATSA